jgi:hypothetical protein
MMEIKPMEVALLSALAFIFGCLVTLISVDFFVINPIKKEAIEKGYASWEVINNSTGKTEFKFR